VTARHHRANDWGEEICWGAASVQGEEIWRGEAIVGAKNPPYWRNRNNLVWNALVGI